MGSYTSRRPGGRSRWACRPVPAGKLPAGHPVTLTLTMGLASKAQARPYYATIAVVVGGRVSSRPRSLCACRNGLLATNRVDAGGDRFDALCEPADHGNGQLHVQRGAVERDLEGRRVRPGISLDASSLPANIPANKPVNVTVVHELAAGRRRRP